MKRSKTTKQVESAGPSKRGAPSPHAKRTEPVASAARDKQAARGKQAARSEPAQRIQTARSARSGKKRATDQRDSRPNPVEGKSSGSAPVAREPSAATGTSSSATASMASTAASERVVSSASTRDRLIESAMRLFYDQGYEATGVKEVLQHSGVNAGSMYYYFPAKEDLLVAVLEQYTELLWPIVLKPVLDRIADPLERIFGILEGYRGMLTRSSFRRGCPIANLALEIGEKSERARDLIARNFASWRLAVRKCLEEAGDRLPRDVDHDRLSMFILTVMEGGVLQSKSERRIEPFDAGVATLRDYLKRLEEDAGGTRSHGPRRGRGKGNRQ